MAKFSLYNRFNIWTNADVITAKHVARRLLFLPGRNNNGPAAYVRLYRVPELLYRFVPVHDPFGERLFPPSRPKDSSWRTRVRCTLRLSYSMPRVFLANNHLSYAISWHSTCTNETGRGRNARVRFVRGNTQFSTLATYHGPLSFRHAVALDDATPTWLYNAWCRRFEIV